jgi:formylglycine-generating enzyme required for sulfatase activity
MVFVEGGTFQMGSDDSEADDNEKPVHSVTLSDFSIGKYEVTNAQFCAFLNEKGNREERGAEWINLDGSYGKEKCRISIRGNRFVVERGYDDHPVIYVSWYGARAFCNWLKEKTGKNYQLPTEAQWEFAARGGNKSRGYTYAGTDELDALGWYSNNSVGGTHKVGQKGPNELGIYDMSGNVIEWCEDWYGDYNGNAERNPAGPPSGSYRVYRGGSWNIDARYCRVTYRRGVYPEDRYLSLGFRVTLP